MAWEQQKTILYPRTTKLAENKPELKSLMVGNEANVKNDLDGAVTKAQKGIRTWQLMPAWIGEDPDHMPPLPIFSTIEIPGIYT